MKVIAIYPGRFQPFHLGHKSVYDALVRQFGADNVYIATSDKVDPPRSPFNFAEKQQIIAATGIDTARVVQTRDPYKAQEITSQYDPQDTKLLFAVSAKDMDEDPRFKSWTRRDGSPAYFQPAPNKVSEMEDFDKHGYIFVVPTLDFKVDGKPMRSATEFRREFAAADAATKAKMTRGILGTDDPSLVKLLASRITEGKKMKSNDVVNETTAGAIGSVVAPLGATQRRKVKEVDSNKKPTPGDVLDHARRAREHTGQKPIKEYKDTPPTDGELLLLMRKYRMAKVTGKPVASVMRQADIYKLVDAEKSGRLEKLKYQTTVEAKNPAQQAAVFEDEAVRKLQQDLIAKGAKIAADGKMGPATQAAMKQFGGAAPVTGAIPAATRPGTEKQLAAIVQIGPGFNVVKTVDGETHRRTGTRPWRNNNPGNISYSGGYAKSQGAIGTDGRYAIFPTAEMGMAACKNLLFGPSSKYINLSMRDAINRYAPSHENDTERYVRDVARITGATPETLLKDLTTDSAKDEFLKAIFKVEGFYTKGKIEIVPQPAATTQPAASPAAEPAVSEGAVQQLSVDQLAAISDEALDSAYHYGRSSPGNTFGWQANLKSAAFAKKIIDAGVTDIEKISDAIHQGWNVTAQAFVKNPMQFDDSKTMAPEKLQAKLAQREKLMTQRYAQLPEDEKEKDRVVARAMLKAITGEQGVAEDFLHDVDHMPGKTSQHQDTNCTTCHGRKSMYKLGSKLFADNKQGAEKVKCPTCKGTGDKPGVAEGLSEMDNRTPSGDRREQRANSPEAKARREKEQQERLKKVSPEMRKKLGLPEPKQGVAEDSLSEFAPGSGGGESGRWYTDDQITDLVGDGWWNDLDISGAISKQEMIQEAQAWLDDQGYSVHVLNCKVNDDDMEWFIEGSFQNSRFAKKGVAESGPFSYGKPPRRGSVAANAAQKRKEQDRKTPAIEPKDQRVGVAKVTKDVKEGLDDTVSFEVDSENAYNKVLGKFGSVIDWHGDAMITPRKYWGAIQELAHDAGGAATEVGDEHVEEAWSQKYKNSINCSHPKGFSQKAHCAGKKKHSVSEAMEMTCPDCGMCKSHGSLTEIKKGQKDSNGYTKCWPGKHAEGTKTGKNGGQVRNCVPNEGVSEDFRMKSDFRKETDNAVSDFLNRGGEIKQVAPNRVRVKPGQSLASKHIGSKRETGRIVGKDRRVHGNKPVVNVSEVNDYFKRRKDEEDRIAGTKPPAKRTPQQTDYQNRRNREKQVGEAKQKPSAQQRFNARLKTKHGIDLDAMERQWAERTKKIEAEIAALRKQEQKVSESYYKTNEDWKSKLAGAALAGAAAFSGAAHAGGMSLPPAGLTPAQAQEFAATQMAGQQAINQHAAQQAGKIDYRKDGPITKSSLGHKLEYGIPVNAKGDFINPNRLPNIHELPMEEQQAMSDAYKTWLKDYLSRWPDARQQPDGSMQAIKPGLAPMYPK